MATTRRRTTKAATASATPARRGRPAKVTQSARKAAPVRKGPDVTVYAEKEPTDYHKAFANWIVKHVGYDPNEAGSKRAAFLAGVSIATASRPAFMNSEYLEEWRERNGVTKRGPKGGAAEEAPANRRSRRAKAEAEPEPVEDDDEFEDDEEIEDDDEFDDEDSEDDDSEDDDEFDDDDDEELEDEEEEETPAPRRTRAAAKAAPAKKAAPRKAAPRKATAKADDDDFIF
jgi:Mg-chelatase subunit ChlI